MAAPSPTAPPLAQHARQRPTTTTSYVYSYTVVAFHCLDRIADVASDSVMLVGARHRS